MNPKPEQLSLSEGALAKLQQATFGYFLHEANVENGMVPDSTRENSAASIAAIGCPPLVLGLRRAGFTNGWLSARG